MYDTEHDTINRWVSDLSAEHGLLADLGACLSLELFMRQELTADSRRYAVRSMVEHWNKLQRRLQGEADHGKA